MIFFFSILFMGWDGDAAVGGGGDDGWCWTWAC